VPPVDLLEFQEACQELHQTSKKSLATVVLNYNKSELKYTAVIVDDLGHMVAPMKLPPIFSIGNDDYSMRVIRADGELFDANLISQSQNYGLSLLRASSMTGAGAKPMQRLQAVTPGTNVFCMSKYRGLVPIFNYAIVPADALMYRDLLLQPLGVPLHSYDVSMVMNVTGELIGIGWPQQHAEEFEHEQFSFFVPIEAIYSTFQELERPWPQPRMLGLRVTETLVAGEDGKVAWALLVSSVEDGACASKAGVEAGDTLISLGGQEINSIAKLREILQACPLGSSLEVLRNGEIVKLAMDFAQN
jgi:hypothetical protein